MKMMTQDEFKKIETLEITECVWVGGELKKPGDTVEVSGNDKVQLLASGRAKVPAPKSEKSK